MPSFSPKSSSLLRSPDRALGAVAEIGEWLCRTAQWDGSACTWLIRTPRLEGSAVHEDSGVRAGSDLYQGAPGIALFLAEASRACGNSEFARVAHSGLQYSLHRMLSGAALRHGLYTGSLGGLLGVARAGLALEDQAVLSQVRKLVGELRLAATDRWHDCMAGRAGSILALIALGDILNASAPLEQAAILGDGLIADAHVSLKGWSWGPEQGAGLFDLLGYAHGASGIAHAFLELYAATGESKWSVAALGALAYERGCNGPQRGDYWDYRQPGREVWLASLAGAVGTVEKQATEPAVLPTRAMRAWCHGAPGIALVRMRAFELGVGVPEVLREAKHALGRTCEALLTAQGNFSLCHGRAGLAEIALEATRRGLRDVSRLIARTVDSGLREVDTRGRWRSGVQGELPEPSLMVGESGIGLFLLRAVDPNVSSILFITGRRVGHEARPLQTSDSSVPLQVLMPTFVERVGNLGLDLSTAIMRGGPRGYSAAGVRQVIAEAAASAPAGDLRRMIHDAARQDLVRLETERQLPDEGIGFIRQVRPQHACDFPAGEVLLHTVPELVIVRSAWQWQSWSVTHAPYPTRGEENVACYLRGRRLACELVHPFAALVLELLRTPLSWPQLLEALRERTTGGPVEVLSAGVLRLLSAQGMIIMSPLAKPNAPGRQ